jgi:hypothetical protein
MVGNALSVALVGELIPNIEEVIKDKLCYSYLLDKLILVTINIFHSNMCLPRITILCI